MPADITWSLSGVDTVRWNVQAGSLWRPPVTVRRSVLTVPGRHGSLPTARPPVFEEPTVTLELLCLGAMASLEAAVNEAQALLSAPGLVLGRSSGGVVTSAPAALVSISPGDFFADRAARVTAMLAVPGVFLRGASADSASAVVPATVALPALAAGTAPVGDAVLRVKGPFSALDATDPVSGTGISWSGAALNATTYLYIDLATLTARTSTSSAAWETGGADVSGGLSYPAAGPLQIWPRMAAADPAVRSASLVVTATGADATTALVVRAAPAYL